eukprot:CAMPEP_0202866116 /NCGR_PEP_ID=MMETSP1391-20130828/7207_1 /ASSEMBLY_ACC=CAM_ASM_000867 /TAXON_ID=1034604 /ORGANISM="Chlamydomonas leiostraca, Strain SAG 11-49" /LENGTH=381 /DNA_ID=CAMNT_0049546037 /DNA_START=20 /DNA_END=1165 /DNA_ORIENTATION=+
MEAVMQHALSACPFLSSLQQREGTDFACNFALNPTAPAAGRGPVLEEWDTYALPAFASTFSKFHGPRGVVPLARSSASDTSSSCPATASAPAAPHLPARSPLANAPLATMSLGAFGNMPDFGKFLRAMQQQHKRKPPSSNRSQHPEPQNRNIPNSAASPTAPSTTSNAASGGTCPMRKVLGPLAPIIFNPKGHLQCPEPIIRARAALAATKPVKELRPQALPIKLLAVGATTAAVNLPCGMWREHTEKFSAQWILAVHASIPFIAMLRKAVIMPKYAILFTIATAIAGQAMGAKLERRRLAMAHPTRLTTAPSVATSRLALRAAAPVQPPASSFSFGSTRKHQRPLVKSRQGGSSTMVVSCSSPAAAGAPAAQQRALVPVR